MSLAIAVRTGFAQFCLLRLQMTSTVNLPYMFK